MELLSTSTLARPSGETLQVEFYDLEFRPDSEYQVRSSCHFLNGPSTSCACPAIDEAAGLIIRYRHQSEKQALDLARDALMAEAGDDGCNTTGARTGDTASIECARSYLTRGEPLERCTDERSARRPVYDQPNRLRWVSNITMAV